MNIFYVHHDPVIAAQSLVDKHVVKMILESAQLLSTAHRFLDGTEQTIVHNNRKKKEYTLRDSRNDVIYKATHINHPSAIWVRQSVLNYQWLVDHFYALMDEYTYRYDKKHKCLGIISYMLSSPPLNLRDFDMTPMLCAMDDIYKVSDDPVENYRNYYRMGKKHLYKWTKRTPPDWIGEING